MANPALTMTETCVDDASRERILQDRGTKGVETMKRHLATLTVAAALAAGLTSTAAFADPVRLVNVTGYTVIDRQHVVLNGGASRHYLVTLRRTCPGLNFGTRLGMSFPSTTTIRQPVTEYFIVDGQRCHIDTVEIVDSAETARTLIAERAEARGEMDSPSN